MSKALKVTRAGCPDDHVFELRTTRMRLVAGTPALAEAELSDREGFAALLGASVPPTWPPETLREVLPGFLANCRRMGNCGPWTLGWYGLLKEDGGAVLCGSVGFKGAPDPQGMAEIGYSVVPPYEGRGIASEMLEALSRWALSQPGTLVVEAEVVTANRASVRVLEKAGFTPHGVETKPGTARFRIRAAAPTRLADGRVLTIDHVSKDDAAPFLDYANIVSGESDFLTFGSGELGMTIDEEVAHIQRLYTAGTGFMLKAVVDGEIVSVAGIQRTRRPRIRHVGVLGISVLKRFWGTGVGRATCQRALLEAEKMGLRRVELRVREDNLRAQRLYQSLGFIEEGRLRGSFVVASRSFDELIMGLLLQGLPRT